MHIKITLYYSERKKQNKKFILILSKFNVYFFQATTFFSHSDQKMTKFTYVTRILQLYLFRKKNYSMCCVSAKFMKNQFIVFVRWNFTIFLLLFLLLYSHGDRKTKTYCRFHQKKFKSLIVVTVLVSLDDWAIKDCFVCVFVSSSYILFKKMLKFPHFHSCKLYAWSLSVFAMLM